MFLIFLVLVAILAPVIVKYLGSPPDEFHQDLIDPATGGLPIGARGGQSWDHLMGVEPVNGRDIFSRIVYGARISLLIAFLATLLSVLIGTTLGTVAGFFGGWVDAIISRTMDVFLAFPLLVFAIALAGVIPDAAFGLEGNMLRIVLLVFIIGFFNWPYIGRIIRGQTLSLREREFVDAARSLGSPAALHPVHRAAAEPGGADPRLRDAADPHEHPVRGSPVVPRCRGPAADRDLGRDALRRGELLHDPALHVLARTGHLLHGPGLQPVRGRAA